jgi:hypothetical protein
VMLFACGDLAVCALFGAATWLDSTYCDGRYVHATIQMKWRCT